MKKATYIFLFLLILSFAAKAQIYRIVNIDHSKFPVLSADIIALTHKNDSINLFKEDVRIIENGKNLKITSFESPKSNVEPLSIVLVLDNSGSMKGFRFDILKQTAKEFLAKLPLEVTEVAIASFNSMINLQTDFTHDKNRLNEAIDKMNPNGGTDFNAAFLTEFFGTLDIAKYGKYKRIVIFITDGLSAASVDKITKKAVEDSININNITIALPISDELKDISNISGGNYFSELNNESEIETAFKKIYKNIQQKNYGRITWKSTYSCFPDKTIDIYIKDFHTKYSFKIPNKNLGKIEVAQSNIIFDSKSKQTKALFIKGKNTDLNISNIVSSNAKVFSSTNTSFPFQLKANQWESIDLIYTPFDTVYTTSTINIINDNCPNFTVSVSNQGTKKIIITHPNKASIYASKDTMHIKWRGIDQSTNVDFYYQIENTKTWNKLGTGSHFNFITKVPETSKKIRIKGLVTSNINLRNLYNLPNAIVSTNTFNSAICNTEGNEIITTNRQQEIETWNAKTGEKIRSFEKPAIGITAFYPNFKRVASISSYGIDIFTNRNGMFVKSIPLNDKKTLSSYCFIDGREFYTSALSTKIFWDPSQNITINNIPGDNYNDGACSKDGKYFLLRKEDKLNVFSNNPIDKLFSIKTGETFEKAILHVSQPYFVVLNKANFNLYSIKNGEVAYNFSHKKFIQFDESGKYIFTCDSIYNYIFSLKSNSFVDSIPNSQKYSFSKNGKYIAIQSENQISIKNISTKQQIVTYPIKNITSFGFDDDGIQIFIQNSDSLFVFNNQKKQNICAVECNSNVVQTISFATKKTLLIFTHNLISLWPIETKRDIDTSDFFQVIIPEPIVKKELYFKNEYVNHSCDAVFINFIKNETNHPIFIDSIFIDNPIFRIISKSTAIKLNKNESFPIEIQFTPIDTTKVSATLTTFSSKHSYTTQISGKGIRKSFEIITPVCNFNDLKTGLSTDTLIPILKNTGTECLEVSNLFIDNSLINYKLWSHAPIKNIKHGDTLYANIEFTPKQRGRTQSQLYIQFKNLSPELCTQLFGKGIAKKNLTLKINTLTNNKKNISAKVNVTELNSGRIIQSGVSNTKGIYATKVNTDLNYSITAELKGYFSHSENIDLTLPQIDDTLFITIELTPLQNNSLIRLNNIFFETGSSKLLDISKTELDRLHNLMDKNPSLKIEIHGHTDNVGSSSENIMLSKYRAQNVQSYLNKHNIPLNRIQIQYFGESNPIADNATSTGKKLNRRVEIKLIDN